MRKQRSQEHKPVDATFDRPRVVVRFRESVRFSVGPALEEQIEQSGIGPWKKLTAEFPDLRLSPVFTFLSREELQDLTHRAVEVDPTYRPADFSLFFFVDAPPETDLVALVRTLLSWNSVQTAYVDQGGPDPGFDPSLDGRFMYQGYLDPAPDGIDAEYAWTFVGGDGEGQQLIDLEKGWTLNHEDLAAHGAVVLHGMVLDSSRAHGTAVLGIICAVPNGVGCVGIAPRLKSVNVVSSHGSTREDAILAAITKLAFGDTLLLEAQVEVNSAKLLGPIEVNDANYEVIRLATALGIIVVEAGGNGTDDGTSGPTIPPLDMDTYFTADGRPVLDRTFRDSGAIIVTAATPTDPHTRFDYAPHGQRIDCYAWGADINTLSSNELGATTGVLAYTVGFGRTSGAAAIIAGAALAVQGRAEALLNTRFSPHQMRAILSDPSTGTKKGTGETTLIGVMPNLRTIFDDVLNSAPDVYLRDHVGDDGEPHVGFVSASPDIILRPAPVADPQLAFGAGSGTENDATLGSTAEIGQDNHIYVRVLNRGGSNAIDVKARVFWAPVATLITGKLWKLIGSTILPNVPMGDQLTVSDAILWHQAEIPGPGHYCFVGLVGNAADPAPEPAGFRNWDNFVRFIRENNNVAWRNFNVANNEPDVGDPTVPEGFQALSFLAPGAPDKARPMALEVIGRLPEGAKAMLEVPLAFRQLLQQRHQACKVPIDRKRRVALLPVNPHGRMYFGDVLFPAGSRMALRLLVEIPKRYRGQTFRIAVRQIWEGIEVGRVTWQLQSKQIEGP